MPSELPETIDPMRLAKECKVLSGSYELRQFDRVNASLMDESKAQVFFKIEFSSDEENQLFSVVGDLQTSLPLICQRCMQPMQHQLSAMIKMAIVRNEAEAENLPAEFEPYIDIGVPVKLQDFIEDELLLAMPLVSFHEEQECPAADTFKHVETAKENPFAELKNFKIK
jgi:uncharacterized protein